MEWIAKDIPPQEGRTAVVTGANVGLGLETAAELAGAGATVILASRDSAKADSAASEIGSRFPDAEVHVVRLDLASLSSVGDASEAIAGLTPDGIDLLINNAGVMMPPRRETADGFELQLGTNHLGHFALTGKLLPLMTDREGSRVVTVSSGMARLGKLDFDDLQGRGGYSRTGAYAQSKLANLVFAIDLNRRLESARLATRSLGAHPGYAATDLQVAGPRIGGGMTSTIAAPFMALGHRLLAQSAADGALSTLRAATDTGLPGGSYVGPSGPGEMRGTPVPVEPVEKALDRDLAERLWQASVELTGVEYLVGDARPAASPETAE
jgi:NAD(P)-dependent dehydrogenase (short-subunit alcohol dehydrogenase family)